MSKFQKGNRASEKPKFCPFCGKELKIRAYAYIEQIEENQPILNGIKEEVVTNG